MVVLRTDPAFANVVAQWIDTAAMPGVLGTVAGDDTVFVALAEHAAGDRLRRRLGVASSPPAGD
jgi:transcriptional regulator of arginine metabolism